MPFNVLDVSLCHVDQPQTQYESIRPRSDFIYPTLDIMPYQGIVKPLHEKRHQGTSIMATPATGGLECDENCAKNALS
jgi:hypothetical protein